MVEYHKSSAPLSLCPHLLEINVDLTPIKLLALDLNSFSVNIGSCQKLSVLMNSAPSPTCPSAQ